MLKNIEKQTLTVHNKMELGEDISVEAKGKGRKFVSRFIEPGVAHYEEFGDVLITKETLDRFINTMVGCPVIIQHKDIDDENVDKERVGVISNVWFNEFDGWYYCDGIIWDKQAIDLIKNQDWSVSCTYDFDSDKLEKTHNGKKIDMEFTGGEFLHLALVPNPRYERANIVMNAKEKDDDIEWITVHGNHIPVKKGQSKDDAVKEFIEKQEQKQSDKQDKVERDWLSDYKENTSHYGKKEHEEEIISLYEGLKNKDKSEARRKEDEKLLNYHLKELNKYQDTSNIFVSDEKKDRENKIKEIKKALKEKQSDKKIEPTQPSEPAKNPPQRKEQNPEPGKKKPDIDYDEIIRRFTKKDFNKLETKNIHLHGKSEKDGSLTFIDYDMQNKNIKPSTLIEDDKIKVRAYTSDSDKHELKIIAFPKSNDINKDDIEDAILKSKEKINKKYASNSTNVKEITMSVLNELESFIKGVIKNADDEDKKEEVKNEDKRKLIDEVGGILKGKVDDEIIKTIMKKMEEASYEPSEDKKADNEADEEEKEEKFEEEKKIANKCKNEEEDKKEKEDKVEDEDDEKDEDDEVDKEEVKNKCKNSMKDVKEIIMGGKSKIETDYISKADRFALGEQY